MAAPLPTRSLPPSLRNLYKGASTSRKAFRLAKSLNQYHKLVDALKREVPGRLPFTHAPRP